MFLKKYSRLNGLGCDFGIDSAVRRAGEDLNHTEFLTRPLLLCFTSINVMHTSAANANVPSIQCIAAPRPSMRIIGSNARAGTEA